MPGAPPPQQGSQFSLPKDPALNGPWQKTQRVEKEMLKPRQYGMGQPI